MERHFRVYDAREERMRGELVAHMFFVMFPQAEFDARYEAVRRDIRALDQELLVFLRREGGEDILFVAPRPAVPPARTRANVVMLVLTLATTTVAGIANWQLYMHAGEPWQWSALWQPRNIGWGMVTFALPLMAILGVHEAAHYFAARRHGLRATLPYFIPVPPFLFLNIGTLGAFIRLQDPLPDRKTLFDVGASGPIAGFALAVPLLLVGAVLTAEVGVDVPDIGRPEVLAAGFDVDETERAVTRLELSDVSPGVHLFEVTSTRDGWRYTVHAEVAVPEAPPRADATTRTLDSGQTAMLTLEVPEGASAASLRIEWQDGIVEFGEPLLLMGLSRFLDMDGRLSHPTFFAAWVGILVTGLNLLPVGQLDGGHVARAVLGERVRWLAAATLAVLLMLALFYFPAWIILAVFVFLTGLYHPPPLNDRTPLDTRRKMAAAFVLLVFFVTFIPVPVHF